MNTVIIKLANGIMKVAELPDDTQVVLEDLDTDTRTTYKREANGGIIWKKRSKISKEVVSRAVSTGGQHGR